MLALYNTINGSFHLNQSEAKAANSISDKRGFLEYILPFL